MSRNSLMKWAAVATLALAIPAFALSTLPSRKSASKPLAGEVKSTHTSSHKSSLAPSKAAPKSAAVRLGTHAKTGKAITHKTTAKKMTAKTPAKSGVSKSVRTSKSTLSRTSGKGMTSKAKTPLHRTGVSTSHRTPVKTMSHKATPTKLSTKSAPKPTYRTIPSKGAVLDLK